MQKYIWLKVVALASMVVAMYLAYVEPKNNATNAWLITTGLLWFFIFLNRNKQE